MIINIRVVIHHNIDNDNGDNQQNFLNINNIVNKKGNNEEDYISVFNSDIKVNRVISDDKDNMENDISRKNRNIMPTHCKKKRYSINRKSFSIFQIFM